jgi:formylglycine-generating enzyme
MRLTSIAVLLICAAPFAAAAQAPTAFIPGGEYASFYPAAVSVGSEAEPERKTKVAPFRMDVHLVTNAQFLAFVREHPTWRRGAVPALFADTGYLRHWSGPDTLGDGAGGRQPVSHVSWFAARAYCRAGGGRLPTEDEWEFVARADAESIDASDDPQFLQTILSFYGRPRTSALAQVGMAPANAWGLHDIHGLVWEWVEDFNASLMSGDNRQDGDEQLARFCGGASLGAENVRDYATFMRFAFRSSLEADYTVRGLGFRCVRDAGKDQ